MIPHHHLGMELIDEATRNSDGVELRRLVFEMGGYHHDELTRLTRWAKDWGIKEALMFPGGIAKADLARLASLRGPGHDTWWLHVMIEHHRGALVISREALASANDPGITSMAESVISVQEKQIGEMEDLSLRLCRSRSDLPGC